MSPEQLFPRPGGDFLAQMAGLPRHLDAAMPMRRQHRQGLPGDIRRLSHLLTDERDDLRRDYLSDPAALSAYMRYFLPWNVYRLGVLFNGLALDPGGDDPQAETTVIDLGSGPLTAPLALWMARPHLRRRALHFICVDRAHKPMRLGLDALNSLAAKHVGPDGASPWRVTLVKGSLDDRLREKADLVIMANALNEVLHRGGSDLLEDAETLSGRLSAMLTPAGQLLIVEPGVRPSAHLISALRRGLLHRGLNPLAPCPHTGPCPMSGRGYTAWCHFNFDAEAAPAWLKRLSDDARLAKDNVSLSFLHFAARGRKLEAGGGRSLVRAVSGPFELPGEGEFRRYGQYACSERGLTLLSLPRKHLVPMPGALLEAAWPEAPEKDAKSGALVLPLGQAPGGGPGMEAPAPRRETPLSATPGKPKRKPERLPSERPLERGPRKPRAKPPAGPAGPKIDSPKSGGLKKAALKDAEQAAPAPKAAGGAHSGTHRTEDGEKKGGKPKGKASGRPSETPKSELGAQPGQTRPGRDEAKKPTLAPGRLEELLAEARALEAALGAGDDAALELAHGAAKGSANDAPRAPGRRPGKKKPGQPAVKKTSKPPAKKGGKSAPRGESRAARKARKA